MEDNHLFIGGAGFIGSAVIHEILKNPSNKNRVFVLEPEASNIQRLAGLHLNVLRGSISDVDYIEDIVRLHHITKIVHLVSTLVPGGGYEEFKKEFENVIFPTMRLIQLCSRLNLQFVYFSSGGTVYGERNTLVPFVETDPKEPISYYGLSKQIIENSILFENRISNLQYLILRPSNPYGCGQDMHGRQGLIAVAIGCILSGEPIKIWGDGSSVRDYIFIEDLAKIVTRLLSDNVRNTIVNIGSNKGYSINEVLALFRKIVDEEIKVEYLSSRKVDVHNMVLDTTRLKSLVSIDLTPIDKGIELFYKYVKNRQQGAEPETNIFL